MSKKQLMTTRPDLPRRLFEPDSYLPAVGSVEETRIFKQIQQTLLKQFKEAFPDHLAEKTVVIVPSLTLDQDILGKLTGHIHYEERLLCLLMLLKMPATSVIYITSVPVDATIIDYYLHLLPGITGYHARQRLTMLSCYDSSAKPLTQKILERPRLIKRIKKLLSGKDAAHIACFNSTSLEKTLSVRLGIPMYSVDTDLLFLGTKSGSRKLFRDCGIKLPEGFEDLSNRDDVIKALAELKRKKPDLKKAVIKMNDGFSGEGNAVYYYQDSCSTEPLENNIENTLDLQMRIVAERLTQNAFFEKFEKMGGIVEEFLEGLCTKSPSVQARINPLGDAEIVSTHDQVLGGVNNQVFLGASFPADEAYSTSIAAEGRIISEALAEKGVIGRFSIDFMSIKTDQGWENYAIEINLRKGGTTHPFLMLQMLTDGKYDEKTGNYKTAGGKCRYYFSSDNVCNEKYKGLTPQDLFDIAVYHSLMYNIANQEGVIFHMIGALSEFGKIGVVCIGITPGSARQYYERVLEVLNFECAVQVSN